MSRREQENSTIGAAASRRILPKGAGASRIILHYQPPREGEFYTRSRREQENSILGAAASRIILL